MGSSVVYAVEVVMVMAMVMVCVCVCVCVMVRGGRTFLHVGEKTFLTPWRLILYTSNVPVARMVTCICTRH